MFLTTRRLHSQVCADGRFIVEFTFDDLMRIKSWHFATRGVKELIPRSVVSLHMQQDPGLVEQLSKNITRQGLTNVTLNYLRVRCCPPPPLTNVTLNYLRVRC